MNLTTSTIKLILNPPVYYHQFHRIQIILTRITLPFLFIVALIGLITNTATIVLLSRSFVTNNTRHKWTLIALAISDLIHNSALSIRVIHDLTKKKFEYICVIIAFLSQLAELLSACYTVLFTIQRYLAVRYPLKAAVRKRSSPLIIIFTICLVNFLFCVILSRASTYIDCHEELELPWFIADALFSFIIPFSLILIFNIRIVCLIKQHAQSTISKQSIVLRAQKYPRNRVYRPSESIGNSVIHSLTLFENGNVEMEMENRHHSKPTETSSPLTQIDEVRSETSSLASPRPSVRHQLRRQSTVFSRNSSSTSQSIRVTRMLVLVSTCFLLLNAPAHLCIIAAKIYLRIDAPVFNEHVELDRFQQQINLTNHQIKHFVFIHTDNDSKLRRTSDEMEIMDDNISIHLFYMAIQITQWISYLSYSINFFLYSFSGIHFRSNLRQCWKNFRRFSPTAV